jgi:hypothetical protein
MKIQWIQELFLFYSDLNLCFWHYFVVWFGRSGTEMTSVFVIWVLRTHDFIKYFVILFFVLTWQALIAPQCPSYTSPVRNFSLFAWRTLSLLLCHCRHSGSTYCVFWHVLSGSSHSTVKTIVAHLIGECMLCWCISCKVFSHFVLFSLDFTVILCITESFPQMGFFSCIPWSLTPIVQFKIEE